MSLIAEPALAACASDFSGLPICSKLRAMPRGYHPIECNSRTPLRGECRFSLNSNGASAEYLIEDGMVIAKQVDLRIGTRAAGPFGLRRDEDHASAAHKILASTGLTTRYWDDSEDETAGYLQSTDVMCGRNKSYTIYVWFRRGKAQSVSVSAIPAT
ncbi:hypothetical protein [Blastomonas sp.]|uniref:hypothetical protein n=1 Tax=Blastomonas sp. TaxID=1909299 RepID=UPI00406A8474